MTIYICLQHYDYEGSSVEGVYTNKNKALAHNFTGGDEQKIIRYRVGKNGVGVDAGELELTRKPRRKR